MALAAPLILGTAVAWVAYKLYLAIATSKSNKAFGAKHGCRPTTKVMCRWPLGIDRAMELMRSDAEKRVLELFSSIYDGSTATTLEFGYLGMSFLKTIDAHNMEAIMSSQIDDFGLELRRPVFYPLFGYAIFTQEGAAWKHSRELLRPQFAQQQYRALDIFKDHVDDLLSRIPDNGEVVDIQPLLFRLTLHITVEYLFGISSETLKDMELAKNKGFGEDFDSAQDGIIQRFRLLHMYWLADGPGFRRSCASVHKFVDELIDRRLEDKKKETEKTKRFVFFDSVADEYKDRRQLRDQLTTLLLPGRDASGCLLSWTFYLLSRHQDILTRLVEEIKSTVGDRDDLTRTDIKKMPYLAKILKEVLRLYPSLPINARNAKHDTTLPRGGGPDGLSPILVPKGKTVVYSVYKMHRRKDLYGEDADDFRPDRWDGKNLPLYNTDAITSTWGYLPFNGGPRNCLGQDFALIEASAIIVRILQRFPKIKPAPGADKHRKASWTAYAHDLKRVEKVAGPRTKLTLVMAPEDGVPVVLECD